MGRRGWPLRHPGERMIRIEDLVYHIDGGGEILRGISMEIRPGTYVGVIGPNGSGKTTLVRHMNGLLTPTSGEVVVDGMTTRDADAISEIRQMVGMVFQNPDDQVVGMTVEEDVAFGPGNLRLPPQEIRRRVEESLSMVGMEDYWGRPPYTLSSGEKQRLAIAGVLAMKPRYNVLDELTTYLDPVGRERILKLIDRLNSEGMTIVHVTHDMDEIVRADHIVVLHEGRIALQGSPSEVFDRADILQGLGVGIPTVTMLMWRLREAGVAVRTDIFSVEDACREITGWVTAKTHNPPQS